MPTSSLSLSSSSLSLDAVLGSALFFLTAAWFARYQSNNRSTRPRRRSNLYHHNESADSTNDDDATTARTNTTVTTTSTRAVQRFSASYNDRTNLDKVGPRGQAALTPPIPYLKHFLKCLDNPCDEIDNPQGYSTSWKKLLFFLFFAGYVYKHILE
jgi:hypothetical protein